MELAGVSLNSTRFLSNEWGPPHSQFTSAPFTGLLLKNGIAISMDGRGAWRDNVFVERLWRSVKYEEVYLRAYETVAEARRLIGRYLNFFNTKRPHSSLGARTPDDAYFNPLTPLPIAALISPRQLGRLSGRATPSLRDDPTAAHYATNRQEIHLTEAKRCSEQPDHLYQTSCLRYVPNRRG